MKALVLRAAGDARIEARPEPPPPGPGEVRLRVVRAGLCGTDATEFAAGPVMTPLEKRHPASGAQGPVVLGHEFIGVVEEVGSEVRTVKVGDFVVAPFQWSDNTCPACVENLRSAIFCHQPFQPRTTESFSSVNECTGDARIDARHDSCHKGICFDIGHLALVRIERNWLLLHRFCKARVCCGIG